MGSSVTLDDNLLLKTPENDYEPKEPNATDSVSMLFFYPGMKSKLVESLLKNRKGIVLQAFGMGNGPSKDEGFLGALKSANDSGKIILDTTQCFNV